MRVLLLADYWAGLKVAELVRESVVGLVVPPARLESTINQGSGRQIVDLLDLPKDQVFDGDEVQSGGCLDEIRALEPDIALVVFWSFILKPEFIAIPPLGCINLHCSYLPYNRGKNPNVWPIVEETPAGVSLHYIDPGVDTGDIVARREVAIESVDTGKTLYEKLTREIVALFEAVWPKIEQGAVPRIAQDSNIATHHYAKELAALDAIDMERHYKARDLINILRARTFSPFPAAHFVDDGGRKVYVRVQLEYADGYKQNGTDD